MIEKKRMQWQSQVDPRTTFEHLSRRRRKLTCRKAGVREAVGSDGLDRLRGLKSELLTNSVGMSSSPRGFFDVLPL